ncbi:hypothetical protein SLEP1_g32161 [Rubroshorea leprosula]|uniref:TF-B3 domain-containing protein n=1 Tax=Rubroshorea leprosula TaxID=152421 RepID=A0AAV5KCM1_9ROSI|nr:hypothetical protein SLEP1_g32161 [Rubroshorea leprosula]
MASFVKELTTTDVGSMLVIPVPFMNNMPQIQGGHSIHITVSDAGGREWNFGYYVRANQNPRPVLRSGWCHYVREKGLRVGDRIIFQCLEGFPLRYWIGARRRVTILGQEVWTNEF